MRKISLLLIAVAAFAGCNDVLDEDISNETVVLKSPNDSLKTETLSHQFWWEAIDEATNYQLTIVKGAFVNPQQLILDSFTQSTTYDFTLTPGNYSWGVRAINAAGTTAYSHRYIQIDSSLNLSSQQLILGNPGNGLVTSQDSIAFSWQSLTNADRYLLELRVGNFLTSTQVLTAEYSTTNSLTLTNIPEGNLAWGVRAENDFSVTQFSTNSILIDQTPPAAPALVSPLSNDSISGTNVVFNWQNVQDSGSVLTDSLYVYYRIGNNYFVELSEETTTQTFTQNPLTPREYFWEVKSFDAAGNQGDFSILDSFLVR